MFVGFPSTQTPMVQWWDYSKRVSGTTSISLANDCAPIQYFATGGSTTTINLYLPVNPVQGKTIIIKNDTYGQSRSQLITVYDTSSSNSALQQIASIGASGSITVCYIGQNTVSGTQRQTWVVINNTSNQGVTGYFATNAGGFGNSAQYAYSTVSGGNNCSTTNTYAVVAGGDTNSAAGQLSVVSGGNNNTANSQNSTIGGGLFNTNSGNYATIAGGGNNYTTANYGMISGGSYGTDRGIQGNCIFPACNSPISATLGVSQSALLILAKQTTNATATVLTSDGLASNNNNQVIMPNNSAYYFRGECIAGVTGAGNTKGWYIEGVIKRGANAASAAIVGTATVSSLYADVGAATWSVTATADTTNGGLAITVTGQAATTIRWVCQIRTTEMTY